MKILILANFGMGLYKFRKELIEELMKENEVIVSFPKDEYSSKFEEMGCTFIDTFIDRRGINIIQDFKLLNSYFKIFKKIDPDLILTYTIKPNIYGGIISSIFRKKYVTNITGLGTTFQHKFLKYFVVNLYKIAVRKSNYIVFQNKSNLDFFKENKISNTNISLVPGSGVNISNYKFLKYPRQGDIINFLYIGRVMEDKGIDELLKAFDYFYSKNINVKLDIIGFLEEEKFRHLLKNKKESNIYFHGRKDNVVSYINKSHAIILPSYHEGLSNVLLEAGASGRPLLASDIPGCKEVINKGINGYTFSPKSVDGIVNAVTKFIELSYEEKVAMGYSSREYVEQNFDRKIVLEEYNKIIRSIRNQGDREE